MIRQLTLALAAFGLMIAAADAAQMPLQPEKPGIAMKAPALATGRSAYVHRHWHHRHWHHWHR
jgi:hypothetical protein